MFGSNYSSGYNSGYNSGCNSGFETPSESTCEVSTLVELLMDDDSVVSNTTFDTIVKWSNDKKIFNHLLHSAELMHALSDFCDTIDEAKVMGLLTLIYNMAYNEAGLKVMYNYNYIPRLVHLLANNELAGKCLAVMDTVLENSDDTVKNSFRMNNCVQNLINIIKAKDSCSDIITMAVSCLACLSQGHVPSKALVFHYQCHNDLMEIMSNCLKDGEDHRLLLNMISGLFVVLTASEEFHEALISSRIIDILSQAIYIDNDYYTLVHSLKALKNLSKFFATGIVNRTLVQRLVELYNHQDSEILDNCYTIIGLISLNEHNNQTLMEVRSNLFNDYI